jgi:hypothetical protein
LYNTYGETIDKITLFRNEIEQEFLWKLLPILKPIKLAMGDTLYSRGDHANEGNILRKKIIIITI